MPCVLCCICVTTPPVLHCLAVCGYVGAALRCVPACVPPSTLPSVKLPPLPARQTAGRQAGRPAADRLHRYLCDQYTKYTPGFSGFSKLRPGSFEPLAQIRVSTIHLATGQHHTDQMSAPPTCKRPPPPTPTPRMETCPAKGPVCGCMLGEEGEWRWGWGWGTARQTS